MFKLKIRSRNASASALRRQIDTARRGVYRCGSFTPNNEIFTAQELRAGIIEINTVTATKQSNNKVLMKKAFDNAGVKTATWATIEDYLRIRNGDNTEQIETLPQYPLIIKHIHSSQGNGIYFMENPEQFNNWIAENTQHRRNHIVEHYYNYVREYRLHVDRFGCFCADRKMLREDAEVRWHRHHSNSNWIREDNDLFNRPVNWDEIVAEAQKARKAVGLDICSVDVKVQSSQRRNPQFFILETNAGSALGEETTPLYIRELTRIAAAKSNDDEEDMSIATTQTQQTENAQPQTSEEEVSEQVTTRRSTRRAVRNEPELSAEERANVESVLNDSPADLKRVVSAAEEKKSDVVDVACPENFKGCPNWTTKGEKYGYCKKTDKMCNYFTVTINIYGIEDND